MKQWDRNWKKMRKGNKMKKRKEDNEIFKEIERKERQTGKGRKPKQLDRDLQKGKEKRKREMGRQVKEMETD